MVPEPILSLFNGSYQASLYGICVAVGILACLYVYFTFTKKQGMSDEVQDFSFISIIIALALGFLAAKLFQAVYNWIEDGYFDFYGAGITAMGGFIGGAVAFIGSYFLVGKFYFKKKNAEYKKQFNTIVRVAPLCIVIAHAFGRIGCLMAGCCHGKYLGQEYVFGGIWMKATDTHVWGFYVPTQLYESLFLFILFAVLTVLYFRKSNITMPIYLISYGVWRIIIEVFRTDARGAIILGLAPSQWQSIIFILGGVAILVIYYFLRLPYTLDKPALMDTLKAKKLAKEKTEE